MARKAIVGEKVGMTQIWDADNRAIPVTVVRVAPVRVVQVKTPERDGYSALQVTYGTRKASRLTKPEAGHFARAGRRARQAARRAAPRGHEPATPSARRSPSTSSPPATRSTSPR